MAAEWVFWSVTNLFRFELEVGIGPGLLLLGPGSFYLVHQSLKFGMILTGSKITSSFLSPTQKSTKS